MVHRLHFLESGNSIVFSTQRSTLHTTPKSHKFDNTNLKSSDEMNQPFKIDISCNNIGS